MLKNGLYAPFLRNSKEIRSFFGGLKSAAMSAKHHQAKSMTILTEPMALLKPKKMWVMDRVQNLLQVESKILIHINSKAAI